MFRLVFSALRARRAQTVALFALTVLAAAGGSAAPWFVGWARAAVASADIAAAPASQRVVTATGTVRYEEGDPAPGDLLRQTIKESFDIPGSRTAIGERLFANATPVTTGPTAGLYLGYREDICAHLSIDGACPTANGDVVIAGATADRLGVRPGDLLRFEGFRLPKAVNLRVSGVYEVVDLLDAYWAGTDVINPSAGVVAAQVDLPAFATESTMLGLGVSGLDVEYHLILPPDAFHGSGVELAERLATAKAELRLQNLDLASTANTLIDEIRRDQRLVTTGVGVATLQLVLLCWFSLFLAVRHTSDARRPDIGLLKLRGASRWRIWTLTAQQSALPMLTGAAVGWVMGYLSAAALAGEVAALRPAQDSDLAETLRLSAGAAGVVVVGALVIAVVAEWAALRSSVTGLLRHVPTRRRGWRTEVGDLVVVALAVAGIYQGYAELSIDGEPSTISLLAPGLVGLAVALLMARALPWIAGQTGSVALRSGRPGVALSALHVARRPGTHRVFAVVAVAVSVMATTVFFWHTADTAWSDRANAELGASRVLSVRIDNATKLLSAVRSADPDGRYAMAVARTSGARTEDRVLAVDSTRLAAVAIIPDSYDLPDAARLAELLRPAGPASVRVADGPITVDAKGPVDGLVLHLVTADGTWRAVDLGPVPATRGPRETSVTGCPGGCRLAAVEPIGRAPRGTVELYGLGQAGRTLVSAASFADLAHWRPQLGPTGTGPLMSASGGRLRLTAFEGPGSIDNRVFAVDSPSPLPVVLAGQRPTPKRPGDGRVTVMGTELVPYQVVATGEILPRLGNLGVIVDLEYAIRSAGHPAEAVSLEVWLADDTPAAVVDRLRGGGVDVVTDTTTDSVVGRMARQGPGVALRFALFAAAVLLLVAAGTTIVTAAVERRPRSEELAALRAQGLPDRAMRLAAYAGGGILAAGAILTGLASALVARVAVTTSLPIFSDQWSLLPRPGGAAPLAVLVALAAALAVVGAAAVVGSLRMVRTVRSISPGERSEPMKRGGRPT